MGPLGSLIVILIAVVIFAYILRSVKPPPPFEWVVPVVLGVVALYVLFAYVAPLLGAVNLGSHRL